MHFQSEKQLTEKGFFNLSILILLHHLDIENLIILSKASDNLQNDQKLVTISENPMSGNICIPQASLREQLLSYIS